MRCGKARSLFSSYLESTIGGRSVAVLEEHLDGCSACRATYERLRGTVAMLDSVPEMEPPPDFHAAVMARVERARRIAPEPVRWWRTDWQHVFTIRVPARAAAVGVAVVLLVALAVQLTPLRTGVASLFGLQRPSKTAIADVDTEAPRQWEPWNPRVKSDSGLLIGVAFDSSGVYAIRLGTKSDQAVAFALDAAGSSYTGFVRNNQDSVVQVRAPSAGLVVAKVTWSYKDREREESVFLPARLDPNASRRSLSLTFDNATVRDVLREISVRYGVAVVASVDLHKPIVYAHVERGTPADALFDCLSGSNIKSRALAPSVFMVEPLK